MIIITNRSRDIRIKIFIKVKNIGTVIIIYFVIIVVISTIVFAIKIRPCQTDFLLGVTRAHAKKKKTGALKLFIQKLALDLFYLLSVKKRTLFIYFSFNHFFFNKQ